MHALSKALFYCHAMFNPVVYITDIKIQTAANNFLKFEKTIKDNEKRKTDGLRANLG